MTTPKVVGYNRRHPAKCVSCRGTGLLRGRVYLNTVLWPDAGRAACPCTLQGLRNLDIGTIRETELLAYRLMREGRSRSEVARILRCTEKQVDIRATWVARVLSKAEP